jgi:2'-5' RNA ligase
MKRIFLAIKIAPNDLLTNMIIKFKDNTLQDKIKWVNLDNIHITLKFFGETEENKIFEIVDNITNTIKDKKQFQIEISEIGIFGSKYKPQIIWLRIKRKKELTNLIEQINNNLENIGFIKDRQNIVPHITIGRINYITDKKIFNATIKEINTPNIQSVNVNEILLFESILKKEGPVYNIIERFKLE